MLKCKSAKGAQDDLQDETPCICLPHRLNLAKDIIHVDILHLCFNGVCHFNLFVFEQRAGNGWRADALGRVDNLSASGQILRDVHASDTDKAKRPRSHLSARVTNRLCSNVINWMAWSKCALQKLSRRSRIKIP